MDERNNHFDFDFTPTGQAIKKAREARGMTREQLSGIRKGFLTQQDSSPLEIALNHDNNRFVTGQLLDLAFERFKPCKLASLFPPMTADKLIPPILFLADCGRGVLCRSALRCPQAAPYPRPLRLERAVWKLVNLRNGDFPYFA